MECRDAFVAIVSVARCANMGRDRGHLAFSERLLKGAHPTTCGVQLERPLKALQRLEIIDGVSVHSS
jgi:hypothetical protein